MLINKCLNRILTETEISASHVSHFLLGNSDKKTSNSFVRLNLHNALGWLTSKIKEYEQGIDMEDIQEMHTTIDEIADAIDENENDCDDNDDNDNDDDDEDTTDDVYNISTGNTGYVLVNQMTDYLNRGVELSDMCLYEYCSKVYKTTFNDEEKEKHLKNMKRLEDENKYPTMKRKPGKRPKDAKFFSAEHPQSKTHWQIVRKGDGFVPSLSKLPSNPKTNEVKYQKCILLLFKPFSCFTDLYDGNSWSDSYETSDFKEMTNYIENIQEMHIGLEEKAQNRDNDDDNDEANDDTMNSSDEMSDDDPIDTSSAYELDAQTNAALDTIRSTGWLRESVSNHPTQGPIFTNDCPLPSSEIWEDLLRKQNEDMLNNIQEEDDSDIADHIPTPEELLAMQSNNTVGFSVETSTVRDPSDIATEIMDRYQLNRKQRVAFETAVANVIKRENNEPTEQILGYIGGPGGTGKSQVIKAIVAFHEELKIKHKIRMTAYTGTAAKHIGGSTIHSLFNFGKQGKKKGNKQALEKKFEHVNTLIIDEVSMIGCRTLARISRRLNEAKHTDASVAFGGIDVIFTGDFIQFSPIGEFALYTAWDETSPIYAKKQYHIDSQLGMNLWKQLNHIVLLDEQMRVTDPAYMELLNRLREGKCNDHDVEMLNSRVVGHSVDITSMSGNPVITPGNMLGMAINNLFASYHAQYKNVLVTRAKDTVNKGKVPNSVANKILNKAATQTGQIAGEIPFYVGMPVYLSKNMEVELGLTNGTSGVVRSIHLKNGRSISADTGKHYVNFREGDYIIVEFDDIKVNPLPGLVLNHIPITPQDTDFSVYVGKGKSVTVKRRHFPLVPRFSATAHKSQGMTLDKAIVDLVPPIRKGRRNPDPVGIEFAYVPLSRVRTLQDLQILRMFDPAVLKVPVDKCCFAMMEEFKARDKCKDM